MMAGGLMQVAAFVVGFAGVVIAWMVAVAGAAFEGRGADGSRAGRLRLAFWIAFSLGLTGQTALVAILSLERGTLAVYDQPEFLVSFAWVVSLVIAYFIARRGPWWVAVAAAPVAFLTMGFVLMVPEDSRQVSLASLRSIWLLLHVLTSIVAYAAFTVTFAAGILVLAQRYLGLGRRYALPEVNRVGYRAAVFGFPFMTMVLFTGALWAKHLTGAYWVWDPIETWALVTWLIYSAYLHAQYTKGWESLRSAWLAVAGFVCVISTYFFFTHYGF